MLLGCAEKIAVTAMVEYSGVNLYFPKGNSKRASLRKIFSWKEFFQKYVNEV